MTRVTRGSRHLEKNIWKLCYVQAAPSTMALAVPFLVVYWQDFGLTFQHVALLQCLFSVAMVLLEVPSGYLADRIGRAKVVTAGCFAIALGAAIYVLPGGFTVFCISELFFALGISLLSGADTALLFDSLKELGRTHEFGRWQGRILAGRMTVAALCGILGGFLWTWSPRGTWLIITGITLTGCLAAATLFEASHEVTAAETGAQDTGALVREYIIGNRAVLQIIVVAALLFATSQTAFWMYQPYWKDAGVALETFGILFAILNLVSALSSGYASRLGSGLTGKQKLAFLSVILIGSMIGSGVLVGTFLGVACALLHQVVRGLRAVWVTELLNTHFPSELRATLNSVVNLIVKLFYSCLLLPIGYITDNGGLAAGYFALTFVLIAGIPCLLLASKRVHHWNLTRF